MSTTDYVVSGLCALVGVLLSAVGVLFIQKMQTLDNTVNTLTGEVSGLREDRHAQRQLNQVLTDRLCTVEVENKSFRRILAALDKVIYKALGIDISTL